MSALSDQPAVIDAPPSYQEDPDKWQMNLRREMVHKLEDVEGIKDYSINQYIISSAVRLAKQQGVMGKQVELWKLYEERLAWYRADKKTVYEPREKVTHYGKAAGLNDTEINDILRMAAPHGHNNVCYYYIKIDNLVDEKNGIKVKNPPLKPRAKSEVPAPAPAKPAAPAPVTAKQAGCPKCSSLNYEDLTSGKDSPLWFCNDCKHEWMNDESPSDLDELLGRQRHTRPTPHAWSALTIRGTASQARSAHSHFKTDLAIIDPKADTNTVIRRLLGMDIQLHIEKFGVEITVQKLQAGLDTYGEEQPMPDKDEFPAEGAYVAAANYLKSVTTLSGVPLGDIVKELNKPWPSWSVFDIPGNQRAPKGSKGIKAGAVQARVNEIFGQENIGWRFATHPNTIVHYGEETRESKDEKTSEIKETLWYAVRVEMFIFEYVAIAPDGSKEWIQGSPLSDSHTNMTSRSAAYRGAMSSLLKQAVTRLGGLRNVATQQGSAQQQDQRPAQSGGNTGGGQQKPASGSVLGPQDIKVLMDLADAKKIERAKVIEILGIKGWAEWTGGLDAAKRKLDGHAA